jgi:transcriptional regulator with XRE-family HTH domain
MSTITTLREHHRLSREDLARRLGTLPEVIEQWESGVSSPNEGQVLSLARLFGVSPSAITDAEDLLLTPNPPPVPPAAGGGEHQPG